MTNILEKLRQRLQQRNIETQEPAIMVDSNPTMPDSAKNRETITSNSAHLNADVVKNLMEMLDHTHEDMYSCEETFALLDEYVELVENNNEEAVALMPYVKHHLDKCPGCYDVYAALLKIIQSEPPGEALPN